MKDIDPQEFITTPLGCAARLPYAGVPTYVCTLAKGHDGNHTAHGMDGVALVEWKP